MNTNETSATTPTFLSIMTMICHWLAETGDPLYKQLIKEYPVVFNKRYAQLYKLKQSFIANDMDPIIKWCNKYNPKLGERITLMQAIGNEDRVSQLLNSVNLNDVTENVVIESLYMSTDTSHFNVSLDEFETSFKRVHKLKNALMDYVMLGLAVYKTPACTLRPKPECPACMPELKSLTEKVPVIETSGMPVSYSLVKTKNKYLVNYTDLEMGDDWYIDVNGEKCGMETLVGVYAA